jgi:hypothetical protein
MITVQALMDGQTFPRAMGRDFVSTSDISPPTWDIDPNSSDTFHNFTNLNDQIYFYCSLGGILQINSKHRR